MAPENNNNTFQVFDIIVNNDNYNAEHFQVHYKKLVQNYIKNEYSTIEVVIENYRKQTNSSLFTAIKFFRDEIDNEQYWVNVNIIKLNENFVVFLVNPGDDNRSNNEKIDKLKQILTKQIQSEKIEFIEYIDPDRSYVRLKNIEIALSNMQLFVEISENLREKFQQLKFCRRNYQSIEFEKLIVELGLDIGPKVKSTLKRILPVLKSLLNTDSTYKLPKEDQLKTLSSILSSSNFLPTVNEEDDLIKDVISLLTQLKNRGEIFSKEINEHIRIYFEKYPNKYKDQIDKFNKLLHNDCREKTFQNMLQLFSKYRIEYLVSINKLNSDLKPLKEIDEFMKIFDYKSKQNELYHNKIFDYKGKQNELYYNKIYDFIDIRKELEYYERISDIFSQINFDDLIIILGTNYSNEFILSSETMNIIFEIGLVTDNEQVASAIVKIFNCNKMLLLDSKQKIIEVFNNILLKVSLDDSENILQISKRFGIVEILSVLKFLCKILVESECSKQRDEVFEYLNSLKIDSNNLKYIRETIELEKKCRENDQDLMSLCLTHVKREYRLPMNCFDILTNHFDSNYTYEIIQIILEKDLQKLPKFFIEKFRNYMELSSSNQKAIIRISKLLIKYRQIKFNELKNIEDLIGDHERNGNDIFEILQYQYEHGRKFDNNILSRIRNASQTTESARNIIRLIDRTPSNTDILKNNLEERRNALYNPVEKEQNHTLETSNFLESSPISNPDLNTDAYKGLSRINSSNNSTRNQEWYFINVMFIVINYIMMNIISNPINDQIVNYFNRLFQILLQFIITQKKITKSKLISKLNKLASLRKRHIELKSLDDFEKLLEQDFPMGDDVINLLINTLYQLESNDEDNIYLIIIKILFQIELHQNLNIKYIERIIKQSELLIQCSGIITSAFNRNIEFSEKFIDDLVKKLLSTDDRQLNYYFVCIILKMINQKKSLSNNVIEKLVKLIQDHNQSIETRQICPQILLQYFAYSPMIESVKNSLRQFVLKPRQDKYDDVLNKLCWNVLESSFEENKNDHKFLDEYYKQLKIRLNNLFAAKVSIHNSGQAEQPLAEQAVNHINTIQDIETKLKPLNEFFAKTEEHSNVNEKFHLLSVINNVLIKYETIDVNIFQQFLPIEWKQEILCIELLLGTFQLSYSIDNANEFELHEFRKYIKIINDNICKLNDSNYSIEKLLKILINQQYVYQLDLKTIHEILLMLSNVTNSETLNLFENNQDFRNSFICLRQVWLRERLKYFNIHCLDEDLNELYKCLPYRSEILNLFFEQIDKPENIKEIITFFQQLFVCGLTQKSCELFLLSEIENQITIKNLKYKLDHQKVSILLTNKYSNYAQYFYQTKNYILTLNILSSQANAYNQANDAYYYQANDIEKISSKYINEYSTANVRMTKPLIYQNEENVSENLRQIVEYYKEDHKLTIISLNLTNNHWISLALVYEENNRQHIVLYKDSLGEKNLIDQRESIRNFFEKQLTNIRFKYHSNGEEINEYDSGVFTLGNMKILVENLTSENRDNFIETFEQTKFIKQTEVNNLRTELFPKMYVLKCLQIMQNKKQFQNKQENIDQDELIKQLSYNDIEMILKELFVEKNKVNIDILCQHLGIDSNKLIYTTFDNTQNELIKKLHRKLTKVLHSGWSKHSIEQIITHCNTDEDIKNLFNALDPIYEYNLKEFHTNIEGKSLITLLTTIPFSSDNLSRIIHDLAVHKTFKGTHKKDLQELIKELCELNSILSYDQLFGQYQGVQHAYENKSTICRDFCEIKNWSETNIKEWSMKIRRSVRTDENFHERVAVVNRAVELANGYFPLEIQILSIIILMKKSPVSGRLAQINTGEGKTTIVAMLAVLKALEGHQVDVITSSPELAIPQSKKQAEFYRLFYLTVSHNSTDSVDIKQRYLADIVYGSAFDFQADILRDTYCKLGTRNGRICDVAIVDEVDSMLIDGKDNIVMLTSPMPAMDNLEPLLANIWMQIKLISKCIQEINGKYYYIEHSNRIDDDGRIKSDVIETHYPLDSFEEKEKFMKQTTEKYIRILIRDFERLSDDDKEKSKIYPEIKIPKHLRQLIVERQLMKWIDSAIYAQSQCKNNQHYIFRNETIIPVDAANTGIIQENMHWMDGLHQFLQIKHGAKIKPESLTTNFLSNVTFFRQYKSKLYGLTGTLGSKKARELLNNIYHVDSVIIPPARQKQYYELESILVRNKNDWYENIVESLMNKLQNGRGILIITKYIQEVDEIKSRLISIGYDELKIKTYRNEYESHCTREEIKPGEIIIATNIAGRGTDIRADKINQNGGLHVLITFLPTNERVEQQNIGRTSRIGNIGTGQFILLEKEQNHYEILKNIRNQHEEEDINEAEKEIENVTTKDAIFEEFRKLLTEITQIHTIQTNSNIDDLTDQPSISNLTKHKVTEITTLAAENRFCIWLKLNEETIRQTTKEKMLEEFKEFKQIILDDTKKCCLIKNPYFHVLIGNAYLDDEDNPSYVKAIDHFNKAIKLNEPFQVNAYYNRGYARIALYGKDCKKNKQQIDEAIDDFKKAKRIIEDDLEPMLHIIQQASTSEALSEQVVHKLTLYNVQKNTIELAIGTGKEVNEEIKNLEKQTKRKDLTEENIKQIKEQIKYLNDNREVIENGIIDQARKKQQDIEIEHLEIEKALPQDQDVKLYVDEINEYKQNGFRGCFKIKEIKPIDWCSVIGVAVLGLAQLVGGAALAVFSLGTGSSFGIGLIMEGVSDLITAVKDGIINRDFSWAAYGIQKAISLTVSLVCVGLGAIKDAAKTAIAGVKSVSQTITTTAKTGWKLAAKAIGTGLAKGVAKDITQQLVSYGISKTLMPSITEEVRKRVERPIQNALLANPYVKAMLELDGKNRNCVYESLIKSKAMELLNSSEYQDKLKIIAIGVCKGVATQEISGMSELLTIGSMIKALDELRSIVVDFTNQLNQEIENLYKKENIEEILSKDKQNTKDNHQTSIANSSDGDIDHTTAQQEDEQIKLNREQKSSSELCNVLTTNVSANMCNLIQHRLIAPVTNVCINLGMAKVTEDWDNNLRKQISVYQSEKRIAVSQDLDQHHRLPEDYKQGSNNPFAVAKADDMIDDLKNGGEYGLPHLGALSTEIGRSIKVFDENGELVRIVGANQSGDPVNAQYNKPNKDNPSGHWTLLGGKEPSSNSPVKNSCLLNVIADQTGMDPNQLGINTITRLENDKAVLAWQALDIMRVEQYKRDALTLGGARYIGTTSGEAARILNQSQGQYGEKDPKRKNPPGPGHARGHASDPTQRKNPPGQDCIEDYSKHQNKTGFDSRQTQDIVLNALLLHPTGQAGMAKLNCGHYRVLVTASFNSLGIPAQSQNTACEFSGGVQIGNNFIPKDIVAVLEHHQGQVNNPNADVHVLTVYPKK